MPDAGWMIKGREFGHCNCAYGCPCQFNALPTYGDCKAVVGMQMSAVGLWLIAASGSIPALG
jgi:hypothetical protein